MRTPTANRTSAAADWISLPSSEADDESLGPFTPAPRTAEDGGDRLSGSDARRASRFDEQRLRLARCRAADYFRAAGLQDPDVLAAASQHAVRVAIRSLRDCNLPAAVARLSEATVATADAMRRRTIRRLDAALPAAGGASRRGELSMRLASVLAERPECLLEKRISGDAVSLTRSPDVQGLELPAERPAPFPPQSLVATGSNWLVTFCRALCRALYRAPKRLVLKRSRKTQ